MADVKGPWWSVEQVLAWIFTRDHDQVDASSRDAIKAHHDRFKPEEQRPLRDPWSPLCAHVVRICEQAMENNGRLPTGPAGEDVEDWRENPEILCRRGLSAIHMTSKSGILRTAGWDDALRRRVDIPDTHWIDFKIEPNGDGMLRSGHLTDIVILNAGVPKLWPSAPQKAVSTRRDETEAQRHLCKLIRETNHHPSGWNKDKLMHRLLEEYPLHKEAQKRVWRAAKREAAPPGRFVAGRPKKNQDPEKETAN